MNRLLLLCALCVGFLGLSTSYSYAQFSCEDSVSILGKRITMLPDSVLQCIAGSPQELPGVSVDTVQYRIGEVTIRRIYRKAMRSDSPQCEILIPNLYVRLVWPFQDSQLSPIIYMLTGSPVDKIDQCDVAATLENLLRYIRHETTTGDLLKQTTLDVFSLPEYQLAARVSDIDTVWRYSQGDTVVTRIYKYCRETLYIGRNSAHNTTYIGVIVQHPETRAETLLFCTNLGENPGMWELVDLHSGEKPYLTDSALFQLQNIAFQTLQQYVLPVVR